MCFKGITKMFSGKQERLAQMAAADAQAASDAEAKAANEAMRKALTPPADNEDAKKRSDQLQRRLMSMRGARSTLGAGAGDLAAPSIGLKVLMGQ